MSAANPGSARRWRVVFGRWPKQLWRDVPRGGMRSLKELFGGPPNGPRGPRVLPRSYANKLLVSFEFINLMRCAFENSLQRAPHHHRRRRRFGVTLVVWNEDAREECFQGGAAVAG